MKSTVKRTTALLLVMANVLIVPAMAASDKSKADKAENKSHTVNSEAAMLSLEERPDWEIAISADRARQIALENAGLEEEALKYVTCYLSWSEHAPCAHEVKFSTRTEHYHYTIDLYDGTILDSTCQSRR